MGNNIGHQNKGLGEFNDSQLLDTTLSAGDGQQVRDATVAAAGTVANAATIVVEFVANTAARN